MFDNACGKLDDRENADPVEALRILAKDPELSTLIMERISFCEHVDEPWAKKELGMLKACIE